MSKHKCGDLTRYLMVNGGQLGDGFYLRNSIYSNKVSGVCLRWRYKGDVITGFDCVKLISLLINGGIHQDEIKKNGSTYP